LAGQNAEVVATMAMSAKAYASGQLIPRPDGCTKPILILSDLGATRTRRHGVMPVITLATAHGCWTPSRRAATWWSPILWARICGPAR